MHTSGGFSQVSHANRMRPKRPHRADARIWCFPVTDLDERPKRNARHPAEFLKLTAAQTLENATQVFGSRNAGGHAAHPAVSGKMCQPLSASTQTMFSPDTAYAGAMSKTVLWANVQALMLKHYGEENLSRLSRDCGIGLGTTTRIKQQQTSVGLEIVDKIAEHFSLHPWQLLVPGFDPSNPPTLMPVSAAERQLYDRLSAVVREMKDVSK